MLYLHTRDTKIKSRTHSLYIKYKHELQIQTHPSCFTCMHGLQIERKKVCHCKDHRMNFATTNDRTIKKLFTNQPKITTLREVFFLYIGQLLLTTESKQLDISYMSTHPQEPIITHHGCPTDVE